ncbi:hypothetical protein L6164_015391 [Bauhinia variegata]|uniref:Uncharacterized protein n=1 Tax=Bauhinia variegata TaxID=167791 RepID=A0ACB9NMH4_BAUVA|nr:hypothetical protein L6164_015391 [Bauhinia variegata]
MTADTPLLSNNGINRAHVEEEEEAVSLPCRFGIESKKLWKLAGPAIFTVLCQYSLGADTQAFAVLYSELDLAAIASLDFGIMATILYFSSFSYSCALETLCGQAYDAGQIRMLGVYMQRSWVILLTTAIILIPIHVWAPPILELFGETTEISDAAGKFALWRIPQLFAHALNFPIQKLESSRHGLGGAITVNTSWWLIVRGQLLQIFITESDGAWSGFLWLAFADLYGFVKLSLASAVMLCLEFWYLMITVVITGHLLTIFLFHVCSMNLSGWDTMIAIGFNAAISVRVSNELGAGNFKAAKFSALVVSVTSVSTGVVAMIVVLATRDYFPYSFTTSAAVAKETSKSWELRYDDLSC